jgi:hypothetical protein
LQAYRAFYHLVIFLVLRIFRSYAGIQAVYLRRGGAHGEIVPLVSDIDFALIGEPPAPGAWAGLFDRYERLARITTILDRSLEVYDEETFFRSFQTNDYVRYRFVEGRRSWRLLYGKDFLAELPELAIEEMDGGFFNEIKVWWALFAWRFFQAQKYNDETVTQNNVCFKAVSEVLKMILALRDRELLIDRKAALARGTESLEGEERQFAERIGRLASARSRRRQEHVLEDTKRFLLGHLDGFYAQLRSHPLARGLKQAEQEVDVPLEERLMGAGMEGFVAGIVAHARSLLSEGYRGAALVPSAWFNIDEHLLLIAIDHEKLPTVEEIKALQIFAERVAAQPMLRSRVKLFLLLETTAFQVDPDDLTKSWQSVLVPFANPDLFEVLGRSEFRVDGSFNAPDPGPPWTAPVEHFFLEEKELFYTLFDNPSIYKLESLDWLRIFWKTAQLVVMNRSAQTGEILYPLTLPAIKRGLAAHARPLPHRLNPFEGAYAQVLDGIEPPIADRVPDAIAFLREIEN